MFLLFVCTAHDFYNIRMPFKHLIKMRLDFSSLLENDWQLMYGGDHVF